MRGKCLFREHNAMFPAKSRTWRQCGGLVNTDFISGIPGLGSALRECCANPRADTWLSDN